MSWRVAIAADSWRARDDARFGYVEAERTATGVQLVVGNDERDREAEQAAELPPDVAASLGRFLARAM